MLKLMKQLLLTLTVLFATTALFAQEKEIQQALLNGPSLRVEQTTAKLNQQPQAAFTMYLNAEAGQVEKQWATFVNTRYNCEFKKARKHYEALNIRMLDVAEGTVSLYSKVADDERGARLDVFVLSGTRYLESGEFPGESTKMTQVMESFARALYVEVYDEVLEDERKEHGKMVKELEKLDKQGEKLDKELAGQDSDITKATEGVTDAEQDIKQLQLKIEQLNLEIENAKAEIKRLESERAANEKARTAQDTLVREKASRIDRLKANADGMRLR